MGRGPSYINRSRTEKKEKVEKEQPGAIELIFEHWVQVMEKRKSIVRLDAKRRLSIGAAIHDYGVDLCKQAIEGCRRSPFHMGQNKNGKIYNDIELILRDAEKIERFISFVPGNEQAELTVVEEPW
jgi:hypothetical protein